MTVVSQSVCLNCGAEGLKQHGLRYSAGTLRDL